MGPEAWMLRADEDLRAARACLQDDPAIIRPALFHAQQVAEKALKGILAKGSPPAPPRTHDLEVLLDLAILQSKELGELKDDAIYLTRFAVAPRYPGDVDPVDADEAREAVDRAEGILRRVHELLAGGAGTDES